MVGELEDVVDIRSAKSINALGIVSNDADAGVRAREEPDDEGLEGIGVLILVDEDVSETSCIVPAGFGMILQQQIGVEQEIIEVHCVRQPETLLVGGIYGMQFGHAVGTVAPPYRAI